MSRTEQRHAPHWQDDPAALWRTAAGFGIFTVLYVVLLSLWFIGAAGLFGLGDPTRAVQTGTPGADAAGGDALASGAAATLLFLGSFAAALVALTLMLRLLHGRGLAALIGPWPLAGAQFLRVAGHVALLQAIVWLLPMPADLRPERHLGLAPWVGLLPVALPAILIQIAAEELLFRGYLQSRLSARFANPLVWMVLPSLVFGALHYQGAAGPNGLWFVASATLFALTAADLTARSGTLGPALALHFINNVLAILFIGFGDELGGLALYHLPVEASDPALTPLMPLDLATTAVLWLAARLALRR
ncbi:CPBP family intramembrane metalloprotease [Pseudooceanicola sediminis]|uniref:CPBP family intramembrane metalloprotease n=1 Tax=Pseudooceanicola sediminis TaxID=2211117 RepID=A0A399IX43_9RHOB|nr:CPBP family intramembrane glutamic endopeptidase [Pseudooceanicola sediminis]KAA2312526.1 CPBP family intramembrane metalloprotease [Puniceibacterium sp. HSS470]RII37534.1 CPBP family intramembrane metalloprotease [Pseudooceanicola sediminis]|tara:strand:+ start:58789 stop:59700 length:912 start_codon:yes stop_codon:yes gene_type:complete